MSADRAREFWTPELLLSGKTVFILAGGNSLRGFDFGMLSGLNIIAVNSTAKLIPWADMLFFTDNGWFESNKAFVEGFSGLVVTVSRKAKQEAPDKIRRVNLEHRTDFPPAGMSPIRWGRSSGHTAVSLAVAMGARRIVLLGYDMQNVDGRSHCHDDYSNREPGLYDSDFIPAFDGWYDAARKIGTEIVNATPHSALTEFPAVAIDREIRRARGIDE